MEIQGRTYEIIRPAVPRSEEQPTPRLHQLSEPDQVQSLRWAIPKLFFFSSPQADAGDQAKLREAMAAKNRLLKETLRDALAIFYPLAGRLVERCETINAQSKRFDVRCEGHGAIFFEAWTNTHLLAFLPDFKPHPDFLLLVPPKTPHEDSLLRVQVTHFACGGMCLCMQILHTLCDGATSACFLKCWAKLTCGEGGVYPYITQLTLEQMYSVLNEPYIDGLKSYPYQAIDEEHGVSIVSLKPHFVSKLFHFTPSLIDSIKKGMEKQDAISYFTSFECVGAYLWKNVTIASGVDPSQVVSLFYAVNGRSKLNPPLPHNYFGNVIFPAYASTKAGDLAERPLCYAAQLIKESTYGITNTYMRSALNWMKQQSPPITFKVSSPDIIIGAWHNFTLDDYDFQWGKPSFMRLPPSEKEIILLLPSYLGKGHLDAFVALKNEHMDVFESLCK